MRANELLRLRTRMVGGEFISIQPQQYDVAPGKLDLPKSSSCKSWTEVPIDDKGFKIGVEYDSVQKKRTNIDLFGSKGCTVCIKITTYYVVCR